MFLFTKLNVHVNKSLNLVHFVSVVKETHMHIQKENTQKIYFSVGGFKNAPGLECLLLAGGVAGSELILPRMSELTVTMDKQTTLGENVSFAH